MSLQNIMAIGQLVATVALVATIVLRSYLDRANRKHLEANGLAIDRLERGVRNLHTYVDDELDRMNRRLYCRGEVMPTEFAKAHAEARDRQRVDGTGDVDDDDHQRN